MVKLIVLLLAVGVTLIALRSALFSRPLPRERKDGDHRRSPYVGLLVVVGVTFVLLFALLVLPGLMERLP